MLKLWKRRETEKRHIQTSAEVKETLVLNMFLIKEKKVTGQTLKLKKIDIMNLFKNPICRIWKRLNWDAPGDKTKNNLESKGYFGEYCLWRKLFDELLSQ